MLEKKKPKVILLEHNEIVQQTAALILQRQGWDVTCEQVSRQALVTLKESQKTPFALFISNFKLPKMQGDEILVKVKAISPLTQRMLMVSSDEPDILINAINRAEINACITAPFQEEDLIRQTRICFNQFKQDVKRKRLKNVTVHQNRQMFKAAQKLKKKDRAYRKHVGEQKARLLGLKSRKREIENKNRICTDIDLPAFIDHREMTPTPDHLNAEFLAVCQTIKSLFDKVAAREGTDPVSFDINTLFSRPDGPPSPGKDGAEDQLIKKILTFSLLSNRDGPPADPGDPDRAEDSEEEFLDPLDTMFELHVSDSQTRARIKRKPGFNTDGPPSLSDVLNWLSGKLISYGILEDDALETWLGKSAVDEIIIAEGEDPILGKPGFVIYHFESDFSNPGKIDEDGTIDFRDRGDIPFVKKGTLLAEKRPAHQGKAGISISGTPIPVEEVVDPVLAAGSGAGLSEDGLTVHADIDGQPHVDALGTVFVSPELVIDGDVDFETGNVDFNGDIRVKGTVKEGFHVKGISLTAQEIEGATISLSGDLNVSAGITDSTVSVRGNIQAKFINNSKMMGFGDLTVSKEIIDTDILLSGCCQNATGHIISSTITAKLGIESGSIGTSSSTPSRLKIGVDEHVETMKLKLDETLDASVNKAGTLKDDIKKLEDEDQALYEQISEKAHIQDRAQLEIKEIKQSLPEFEKEKNGKNLARAMDQIKDLAAKARSAEQALNAIFEDQDHIARRIEQIKKEVDVIEKKNKKLVLEKRALDNFAKKYRPRALVTVNKTITQDTVIKGPRSSIVVQENRSRVKIQELEIQEQSVSYFQMVFSDLQ